MITPKNMMWRNTAAMLFAYGQLKARENAETALVTIGRRVAESPRAPKLEDAGKWIGAYRARDARMTPEAASEAYRKYSREQLAQCDALAFSIHVEQGGEPNWRLAELPKDKLYPNLTVSGWQENFAADLQIGNLTLRNSKVELVNCTIERLVLHSEQIEITIRNCWIGTLVVGDNAILGDCVIEGGGILAIITPPPGIKVFRGYLQIDRNTYVPIEPNARMRTPSAYLFLRHQLTEIGNMEAAGFFGRAEQYFSYRTEPGAAKLVSFIYWLASDYGTSITRPLAWTLGLIAAGTALAFAVGPTLDPDFVKTASDGTTGALLRTTWYSAFLGEGYQVRLARATAVAWGAALNPFSVFGDRGVVLMPTLLSNLALKSIGALATLSFAMLFLAIRRRFRLT